MTQPNFRRFSSRRRSHSSLDHWGRAACDVVELDHAPLARGSTLGRYRILELLGQGGMGTVYRAEDTFLHRQLAIKVLDRANMDDAEAVRRFLLEAQTMAQLDHPNVVHLFDAGTEDKYCYLVMELIDGADGEALLANGPLDWRAATEMIADACRGLAHAHAAGMIHRDIKPGNILRGTDGVSHLSDFGLVKMLTDHWPVTMPHAVIGTPDFMSPEQFFGERVGPASDIYSLGATYFALLTGHAPFESAQNLHELAEAHRSWRVPDPRTLNPAVPRRVRGDHPAGDGQATHRALSIRPRNAGGSRSTLATAPRQPSCPAPQPQTAGTGGGKRFSRRADPAGDHRVVSAGAAANAAAARARPDHARADSASPPRRHRPADRPRHPGPALCRSAGHGHALRPLHRQRSSGHDLSQLAGRLARSSLSAGDSHA
jgi:serine/threonine protein kinase